MDTRFKLQRSSPTDKLVDSTKHRSIIGGAMHLMTGTRPDTAFAISRSSCHVNSPNEDHMNAARHLVRCLKGTRNLAVLLGADEADKTLKITRCVDASHASDIDTRRSASGFITLVNNSPVFWKAHRQAVVTLSSAEAECAALSAAMSEMTALTNLPNECNVCNTSKPSVVCEDDQAVIKMSTSLWTTPRSRHMGIEHHHVRELLRSEDHDIEFVRTSDQLADSVTKAVPRAVLSKLLQAIFDVDLR